MRSDEPPLTSRRRAELKKIVREILDSGVVEMVCVCTPKRSDLHACPIDPSKVTFTELLMRL